MRVTLLWTILLITASCRQERTLNLNPLQPNEGLYKSDLELLGFEMSSAEDGLCVYSQKFDSLDVYFIMDFDDDCNKVKLQGIAFPFDTFEIPSESDSIRLTTREFPMDIEGDSIAIGKIINDLGGKIVSNRIGAWPTHCRYEVINITTDKMFSASIYYGTDSKKYLTIEYE